MTNLLFNINEIVVSFYIRFDPEAQAGELHLNIKNLQYRIEYESNGYILTTDLSSRGVFSGNACKCVFLLLFNLNIQMPFRKNKIWKVSS